MQTYSESLADQDSKTRKACEQRVAAGWRDYYYIKEILAATANDPELAKHYSDLQHGPVAINVSALNAICARISKYESLHAHAAQKPIVKWEPHFRRDLQYQVSLRQRAVAHVAGLRFSEHELIRAMEYIHGHETHFLDERSRELARIWNRRALELIEGPESERALGFMMITTPTQRLNANRTNGWKCVLCFRHSKETTRYCGRHSPVENPAGRRRYWRESEYSSSNDAPESVKIALAPLHCRSDSYRSTHGRIDDLSHMRGWIWDTGLFNQKPPADWKERIAEWQDTFRWLPAMLYKQNTWPDAVAVLRTVLEDDYCLCDDFELWEAKVQARNLEYDLETAVRTTPKKRRKRSSLASQVALLARNPSMTQNKIAERLGVSRARVSQVVNADPGLQHLKRKFGRKTGVS